MPQSRRTFLLLAGTAILPISGCLTFSDADVRDVPVDIGAAASAINGYRTSHGLAPLQHDARLDAVSADMARRIARNDSMNTRAHSARGLSSRLDRAGYPTYAGAENLGAGYTSLGSAMAGWKGSRDHNKNLLNRHVTRFGIARAGRPDGRYRNFWVLTLARPVSDGRPSV